MSRHREHKECMGREDNQSHIWHGNDNGCCTITATDTAGKTATASITVNAITTGNYIRVTSNIESGIAPLE